jgi:hypothetical protein
VKSGAFSPTLIGMTVSSLKEGVTNRLDSLCAGKVRILPVAQGAVK